MMDRPKKTTDWTAVLVFALVVLVGLILMLHASSVGSGFVYGNV